MVFKHHRNIDYLSEYITTLGALGKRTKFQQFDYVQLLAKANLKNGCDMNLDRIVADSKSMYTHLWL